MVYRTNVIECLKHLADVNYQSQAWLSSTGPLVSSFSEDVSQLFDDTGLTDALDQGTPVFNDVVDRELVDLVNAVSAVDQSKPPGILLESGEVARIRQVASSILSKIEAMSDK
jgi:hypothetical protein